MSKINLDAIEKLKMELQGAENKTFAEPVLNHLMERCGESEALSEDVLNDSKNWNGCYAYIGKQAKKFLGGKNGCVRDQTVYEWAEDYFYSNEKTNIEPEKVKNEPKKTPQKPVEIKQKPKKKKDKPVVKAKEKTDADIKGQMNLFDFLG